MYKILIVEDDRIIADNVCEQLLKWGYDVKIADDINVLIAKVQAMLISVLLYAAVCAVASVYGKHDSVYKARGIITCKKQCGTDKFFRIAESAHWCG